MPTGPDHPHAPPRATTPFTEAEIAAGEELFRRPTTFLLSVADITGLPPDDMPEIAFAGRSNVGKSSLVNALIGSRGLARTSNTPGRTQTLNFYAQGPDLRIVDMPGYGYARASKTAVAAWTALVFDYLRGRATLRRVFLLIDARHGIKSSDEAAMGHLDQAAVSYQIVLTKTDKVTAAGLAALIGRTSSALARRPAAHPHILATSARQRAGLGELRAAVAALVSD